MSRTAQFALCVSTAVSAADVPQLRGRQLISQVGDCDNDVCHDHGYTGYNHKNSGTPKTQREVDIEQGVNEWWRCAKMCSDGDCDGWTFAYNGNHRGPYKCYLKVGLPPQSDWQTDPNVISGWSATPEITTELLAAEVVNTTAAGFTTGGLAEAQDLPCGSYNSDDCESEFHHGLGPFCSRCSNEGGNNPLRNRCHLCCTEC